MHEDVLGLSYTVHLICLDDCTRRQRTISRCSSHGEFVNLWIMKKFLAFLLLCESYCEWQWMMWRLRVSISTVSDSKVLRLSLSLSLSLSSSKWKQPGWRWWLRLVFVVHSIQDLYFFIRMFKIYTSNWIDGRSPGFKHAACELALPQRHLKTKSLEQGSPPSAPLMCLTGDCETTDEVYE